MTSLFSDCLNVPSVQPWSRSSSGSEFQTVGPATENDRRPSVLQLCRGTSRWRRWAERSAADWRCWIRGCSWRQGSAAPCCLDTGGLTVRPSLNLTRSDTSSQCKSTCRSCDSPRSYLRVSLTRRAAAFVTLCNLSVTDLGALHSLTCIRCCYCTAVRCGLEIEFDFRMTESKSDKNVLWVWSRIHLRARVLYKSAGCHPDDSDNNSLAIESFFFSHLLTYSVNTGSPRPRFGSSRLRYYCCRIDIMRYRTIM